MNHWMFSCKEVTRLVSESLDQTLPFYQRLGILIHLMMCQFCTRYRKQLLMLKETIRLVAEQSEDLHASIILPPEARDRIQRSIQSSLESSG